MTHPLKAILALSLALFVSACSRADMEYFLAAGPGDWSVMQTSTPPGGAAAHQAQQNASNAACVNSGGRVIGNTCTGRY